MSLHIPPALGHRRFRLLWLGLMVSIAGSQMQNWAIFWHIRTLTGQPIALGGMGLTCIIPVVEAGLVAQPFRIPFAIISGGLDIF